MNNLDIITITLPNGVECARFGIDERFPIRPCDVGRMVIRRDGTMTKITDFNQDHKDDYPVHVLWGDVVERISRSGKVYDYGESDGDLLYKLIPRNIILLGGI